EAVAGTIGDRPIPIGAVIGDQQSALFGQGCVRVGAAKVTYGTGAFLLAHTGQARSRSQHRLLATAALGAQGEPAFALEGSVFIAGAALQWLRDEVGLIGQSADSLSLARQSPDRTRPYVVPAFVGLGAPWWDSEARGAIVGLTRGTTRADLVRATLDSIAYQVGDVLEAMVKDTGHRLAELRVDGGASANDYLMQFQADLSSVRVVRPRMIETTALGAGLLAGLAAGVWRSPRELAELRKIDRVFKPRMKSKERAVLLDGWREAITRVTAKPAPSRGHGAAVFDRAMPDQTSG
ncbi:MAG: FGGY family carbohydrate kinase, partial [Candidatus Binataceae bacterium]